MSGVVSMEALDRLSIEGEARDVFTTAHGQKPAVRFGEVQDLPTIIANAQEVPLSFFESAEVRKSERLVVEQCPCFGPNF